MSFTFKVSTLETNAVIYIDWIAHFHPVIKKSSCTALHEH